MPFVDIDDQSEAPPQGAVPVTPTMPTQGGFVDIDDAGPSSPGLFGMLDTAVRNVGTGLEKGAAQAIGTPRALTELAETGLDYLFGAPPEGTVRPSSKMPSTQGVQNFIFNHLAPEYKPTGPVETAIQDFVEPIGSAPARVAMIPNMLTGAGAAIGDYLAGDKGKTIGGLVGGGAGLAHSLATPSNADRLRAATSQYTPEDWQRAQNLMDAGHATGVPLMGSEALARTGSDPIARMTSDIAATQQGNPVIAGFVNKRVDQPTAAGTIAPGQVTTASRDMMDTVAQPGLDPMAVSQDVSNSADAAVNAVAAQRTAAARPGYTMARPDMVNPSDVMDVAHDIEAEMLKHHPDGPTYSTLKDLRDRLVQTDPSGSLRITNNVGMLDSTFKEFRDALEKPPISAGAIPKETSAVVSPFVNQIRDDLLMTNPHYQAGRQAYIDNSPPVDAIQNSMVGTMAKTADTQGGLDAFNNTIMNFNKARPNEIRDAADVMTQQNPDAFRNAVRVGMENALSTASKELQSGPATMAGANFQNALMGNPQKRENMRAVFDALPMPAGTPPDAAWNGFQSLMNVLDATGRIPGIGSPTASRGAFLESLKGNPVSTVTGIQFDAPLKFIANKYAGMVQGKNIADLADIFTDPNSIARMRELTGLMPQSPRARAIAAQILRAPSIDGDDTQPPAGARPSTGTAGAGSGAGPAAP